MILILYGILDTTNLLLFFYFLFLFFFCRQIISTLGEILSHNHLISRKKLALFNFKNGVQTPYDFFFFFKMKLRINNNVFLGETVMDLWTRPSTTYIIVGYLIKWACLNPATQSITIRINISSYIQLTLKQWSSSKKLELSSLHWIGSSLTNTQSIYCLLVRWPLTTWVPN